MGKTDWQESEEDMLIVVATDEEYILAQKTFPKETVIQTGVGPLNTIERLKDLPKETEITNFGFCGSNVLPIGTKVEIGECELLHENADFKSPTYTLANGTTKCYTSSDFVLKTNIKEPCVFDMELAYILALGFTRVKSIKIVSDTLNYNEYKGVINYD